MFFWIGGTTEPVSGPFCVHVAQVATHIAAGQITVAGPTIPAPDDDVDPELTIVGQIYCPGVALAEIYAPGAAIGDVYSPGSAEAQSACEDD